MKYQVEKSTIINAPAQKVRPLIENFSHWNSWSPWTIVEPNCTVNVEGNPGQEDHSMSWDGNIIGSGRNTIKSNDGRVINYDLEFFKPFKSKAKTEFIIEENGDKTKVTWTMRSKMPFFFFFMVKMMKNWIGMDYDRGLRMLKEISENGNVNVTTTNSGVVDYTGFAYLGIRRTVSIEKMSESVKKDFERIVKDIVLDRKKAAQHWVCIYPKFDMKNMKVTYIAAVSDENLSKEELGSDYETGEIKSGKALEIKHKGSYDFLGNAWSMGMMHSRANKHKSAGAPFEQYWNSPMEVRPEELETSVYFPIR